MASATTHMLPCIVSEHKCYMQSCDVHVVTSRDVHVVMSCDVHVAMVSPQGTATVQVTISDVNDNAPQFTSPSYTASLREDSAVGTTLIPVRTHTHTLTHSHPQSLCQCSSMGETALVWRQ